jgi:hypothetical protein
MAGRHSRNTHMPCNAPPAGVVLHGQEKSKAEGPALPHQVLCPSAVRQPNPASRDATREAQKSKDVKMQKRSHQVIENTGSGLGSLVKTNPFGSQTNPFF